jgi:hypothetical protein
MENQPSLIRIVQTFCLLDPDIKHLKPKIDYCLSMIEIIKKEVPFWKLHVIFLSLCMFTSGRWKATSKYTRRRSSTRQSGQSKSHALKTSKRHWAKPKREIETVFFFLFPSHSSRTWYMHAVFFFFPCPFSNKSAFTRYIGAAWLLAAAYTTSVVAQWRTSNGARHG